jgi:phospholipid/cholesterol/gamma-HCH transport system ATP-binding protein
MVSDSGMSASVLVRDLRYEVAGRTILEHVSIDIEPGEIMAVMGLSGGGKTTFLKCCAGLTRPSAGEIYIGDTEIVHLSESQLNTVRRRIGMVFQYAALFDSMSVYDNVAFGLRYHSDLSEAEIRKVVEEKLDAVGMDGTENLMPAELSGGMRKRVGLARALATNPEVLLYDEPTSGLDPVVASLIDELIVRVRDTMGVTSIVVSHTIPSIFRIADRIAMLYGGRFEAVGTAAEIRETENPVVRQFIEGRSHGPIQVTD